MKIVSFLMILKLQLIQFEIKKKYFRNVYNVINTFLSQLTRKNGQNVFYKNKIFVWTIF